MDLVRFLVRHDRHDLAHAQFRVVQPRIVLALAPDDLGEASAGLQRLADVPERRDRRHEEHGAEARECMVVGPAQVVVLHVGDEEAGIGDARGRGVCSPVSMKLCAQSTPTASPCGPTCRRS